MIKCKKCGIEYDYSAQAEVCMGAVACPGCGITTDQEGNIYEDKKGVKENMERTVVSAEETPKAPKDQAWDGSAAEKALQRWASSDDSGDKEKIDWTKYARGFGWYDSEAKENLGSYKLPHHTVEDGKLVVVWHGVASAMGVINGSMGGVDIPEDDKQKVYNHLVVHYKQFEETPPEFKKAVESFFARILKPFYKK